MHHQTFQLHWASMRHRLDIGYLSWKQISEATKMMMLTFFSILADGLLAVETDC